MGSSHSNKALETFSRQKEGARNRRTEKRLTRQLDFEKRRSTIRQQVLQMTPVQWVMAFLVGMFGFAAGAVMMFYRIRGG